MGSSFDRTCHQLWEECDIRKEGDRVFGSFHFTPIDIDRIAHRLKGIEANSYRKDQVQSARMRLESKKVDQVRSRFDKEVEVFEKAEEAEVENEAEGEVEILALKRFDDGRPKMGD